MATNPTSAFSSAPAGAKSNAAVQAKFSQVNAILEQIPFFDSVSSTERAAIQAHAICKLYKADQLIFESGSTATHGMFLAQGLVMLSTPGVHQRPLAVELIAPSQPFGLFALMQNMPLPLSATALASSVVLEIPADILKGVIEAHTELKSYLLEMASSRLCGFQRVIRNLASASVRTRIAYALTLVSLRLSKSKSIVLELPITRKQLASLAATTVESCIRTIKQFELEGLVRATRPRCLTLLQPQTLSELAGLQSA